MAPIRFHPYSDDPPTGLELRKRLGLSGDDYTYLVSTMALQAKRAGLAPAHQRDPDSEDEVHLVFHRFVRMNLLTSILSRAEERVCLYRAVTTVAQDPDVAMQLKHDLMAWREALADLSARGLDVTRGLSPELSDRLVNASVGDLLGALQRAFLDQQREHGKPTFEAAAHAWLEDHQPRPTIVMEGFTFLTPLQERFLKVCLDRGATVHVVHPYRDAQFHGFAAIHRTFAPYRLGATEEPLDSFEGTFDGALRQAQRQIFSTEPALAVSADGSLILEGYRHIHHEVAACIRRIKEYLEAGNQARDMAIVTRDPTRYQVLLQEEAVLQGLPIRLAVPPRMLLLTPVGRFVLVLYQVWKDGVLNLPPEALETILGSGWLGKDLQDLADPLSSLRAQLFARCRSRDDWTSALRTARELVRLLSPSSRLPVASVREEWVDLWDAAIDTIEDLCRRLFQGQDCSIGQHIERLLDELSRLLPDQVNVAERAVLSRIQEVLSQLESVPSIDMSSDEFGEVVHGLVKEFDQPEGADDGATRMDQIWVTTPEGIDSYDRDIVFFLGVDNRHVPLAQADPWPFYAPETDTHREKERYLFLAVLRATRKCLHLSYSQRDGDRMFRASPYLMELSERLTLPLAVIDVGSDVQSGGGAGKSKPRLSIKRDVYELEEIAHFSLCPKRYQLERMSPVFRLYRSWFQSRIAAQGYWSTWIYWHLSECGEFIGPSSSDILDGLLRAAKDVEFRVKSHFPGLSDIDWFFVWLEVQRQLENDSGWPKAKKYRVKRCGDLNEAVFGAFVSIKRLFLLVSGSSSHVLTDPLFRKTWLLPSIRDQIETVLVDGTMVFANAYSAKQWHMDTIKTKHYPSWRPNYTLVPVSDWVKEIEAGHYPAHPGPHCITCSARGACLGLEA